MPQMATQDAMVVADPEPIFRVASGFMAAKHLFAAAEVGLFGALRDGPLLLGELAARLDLSQRTARIAADAMVALGFVERDGDAYRNGPVAAAYLSGRGPADLRPFLRFWDRVSYANWAQLEHVLRTDAAVPHQLTAEEGEIFSAGVEAITAGTARALAEAHPFGRHRRVLDIGGGTGSFLVAALSRHAHLRATLVEIEPVASIARARVDAGPMADRIQVLGADALADPLPSGHDAILVANVVHLLSPERARVLLQRLRAVAEPDAHLLLVDFWTDPTHTVPPFAALMAGEFALFSDEGDVYSEKEVHEWLNATGWTPIERRPLAGAQTLISAITA